MIVNKYKKFIPDLSAHSNRLIRKIFNENQNNKINHLSSLRSQITIFQKIPITRPSGDFKKFNKENIAFQTCCSLFADLLEAGWNITLGIDDFQISKPEYDETFRGKSLDEVKLIVLKFKILFLVWKD